MSSISGIKAQVQTELTVLKNKRDGDPPPRVFDPLFTERDPVSKLDSLKLFTMIRDEADKRRKNLHYVHAMWDLGLAFIFMLQWLKYEPSAGTLRNLTTTLGQWGFVNPHLYDSVRHVMTVMVQNPPRIGFLPDGNDPEAIEAARAANNFLPHLDLVNETDRKEITHSFEIPAIGSTIAEVHLDESSQRIKVKGKTKLVKIASHRICDPYNFFPNAGATGLTRDEGCRNVIRCDVLHVDEIYDQYGVWVNPETIEAPARPHPYDEIEMGAYLQPEVLEDHQRIYTLNLQGSREAEEGRLIVVSDGNILEYGEGPLENGDLPYVLWRYWPVPGFFWGLSYVRQAIPALRMLNMIMTKEIRAALRALTEWWAIRSDSHVKMREFLSKKRFKYFKYTGEPPKNIARDVRVLSEEFQPIIERLMRDVDNATAYHDVSRAVGDAYIQTLGQADIAEQNDQKAMNVAFKERELAYCRLATMRMQIQQRHGDDEVLFATFGEALPFDMQAFKKTEFNNHLKAICRPDSGRPLTAAAKVRSFLQLMQAGVVSQEIFRDPEAREAASRLWEGLALDELFANWRLHKSIAQNENLLLLKGQDAPVEVGQLHRAHIPIHEKLLNNPRLRKGMKDEVLMAIRAHRARHYLLDKDETDAERQGQIPIEAVPPEQPLAYPDGIASLLEKELRKNIEEYALEKFKNLRRRMTDEQFAEIIRMAVADLTGDLEEEEQPQQAAPQPAPQPALQPEQQPVQPPMMPAGPGGAQPAGQPEMAAQGVPGMPPPGE